MVTCTNSPSVLGAFGRLQPELQLARLHLRFTMELYRVQVEGGRYFVHEHPAYAGSWGEPGENPRSITSALSKRIRGLLGKPS